MNRIDKGFNLFQKGNVELVFSDDEELQFNVKSKKNVYLVSFINGVARCICEDFEFRFQREGNSKNGSFLCSHIFAAMFKLSELKGVNQQKNLLEVMGDG